MNIFKLNDRWHREGTKGNQKGKKVKKGKGK
jgi:hypothetical protein